MTATVLPFIHPLIKSWQDAYEAYHGLPAPKVTRRSNKGFVIHGSDGDSRIITEANLKRLTRYLIVWKENERGVA